MPRSDHFWYDIRETLSSPKFLFGFLAVVGFFIMYVNLSLIYPAMLIFLGIVVARSVIGRRCPKCDRPLKADEAKQDPNSALILHIVWHCPHDGYEETEKTKGDAGLFGAS
ncbi:hypothetical protein QUF64_01210 [Anaerolineales bacterium HSG6]|nr:hypothetical protein [Anaerolineales bacterium HSG6]